MSFSSLVILLALWIAYAPLVSSKSDVGIRWEPYDPQKIASYGQDKITLVNFTADWCITCKTNERLTFANSNVMKVLKEQDVRMVKADWTKYDPEITRVLQQYNQAGVPFYLLYKPALTSPIILPTLLTPGILISELQGR